MNQNDQKPDSFAGGGDNSQFNPSGFGNSTFGGAGGSAFNTQANSSFGAAGNSKFGGNSEFGAGGFGGNSSVSQIFKEGGFGEDEKRKKLMIAGAAIAAIAVIAGAVYFLFMADSSDTTFETAQTEEGAEPADGFKPEGAEGAEGTAGTEEAGAAAGETALSEPGLPAVEDAAAGTTDASAGAAPVAVGENASTWEYNEQTGGPVINVTAGAMVEVSRRSDFATKYVYGPAKNGSFRIPNPPPGSVYWREQGAQTANEIKVNPAPSLGMSFSAPSTIMPGSTVSWSSQGAAAYYRVEFSTDSSFQNIAHAISTKGTQANVEGVTPGNYFVRVGGLNVAAGRFEFSQGSSVSVQ